MIKECSCEKPSSSHTLYSSIISIIKKTDEMLSANGIIKCSLKRNIMLSIITQKGEVVPGVGSPGLNSKK